MLEKITTGLSKFINPVWNIWKHSLSNSNTLWGDITCANLIQVLPLLNILLLTLFSKKIQKPAHVHTSILYLLLFRYPLSTVENKENRNKTMPTSHIRPTDQLIWIISRKSSNKMGKLAFCGKLFLKNGRNRFSFYLSHPLTVILENFGIFTSFYTEYIGQYVRTLTKKNWWSWFIFILLASV